MPRSRLSEEEIQGLRDRVVDHRIEFGDHHGIPLKSEGKVRRYIDIGRLTKGR